MVSGECREGTEKCVESKWNHAAAQLASWKEGAQPLFPGSEGRGFSAPCRDPQSRSPFHSPCSIGQWELVVIGSSWAGSSAHTIPGTEQVLCYNTCREDCPSLCRWKGRQWNMWPVEGSDRFTQQWIWGTVYSLKELLAESRTGSDIVSQGKGSTLPNSSTGEESLPLPAEHLWAGNLRLWCWTWQHGRLRHLAWELDTWQ